MNPTDFHIPNNMPVKPAPAAAHQGSAAAKKKAPVRKKQPAPAAAPESPAGGTDSPSIVGSAELPWTGERLVPSVGGDIALEHLHRYAIAAEFSEGRDILDIACGEGYGSHLLALHARSVTGVDIAPDAVRHADAKYRRPNLSFREGTCTAIPLPKSSVDMVVSFETIEHIAEHDQFLAEIQRVLRKGGLLVISTPERQNYDATLPSENSYHQRELSRAEFEALLRADFRHVHLLGQRVVHSSMILGRDTTQPRKSGTFIGNFEAVEFSEDLPAPTYLLAVCSDAPLPAVAVGSFEFEGEAAPSLVPQCTCHAQIFADQGGGYKETLSARQPLPAGVWQTIRFEHVERLHTDSARRLRIDPVNQPALVELAAIRIVRDSDHAVLYDASSPAEWARLECSPSLLTHPAGKSLLLLATDGDPQIYLPPLPDFDGAACTFEMNLRLEIAAGELARRLHELAVENGSLAALGENWKLRAAQLEATEATWRQLHTEARAAHEAGLAERERLVARIAEHTAEAGQLRARLLETDGQLVQMRTDLEHRIAAHSAEAAELEHRLNERSAEVAGMERRIAEHCAKAAELECCLTERSVEVNRFGEQLRKAGGQLARVRTDLELRSAEAAALRKAVLSAERWQRKWYKRIFHRWRPPGPQPDHAGLLRRLERSIRKRRKSAMAAIRRFVTDAQERRRFFDRQMRSVEKRRVAAREGVLRLAGKLHLTQPDSEARQPEPLNPKPKAEKVRAPKPWSREIRLLSEARLVDAEWYSAMHPEAQLQNSDAVMHYLSHGAAAGSDPNPLFQTLWYLEQNPDVAAAGLNPLVHYVEAGWREGRNPHPRFNTRLYLQANPDVAAAGIEPLAHYLWTGINENRVIDPAETFGSIASPNMANSCNESPEEVLPGAQVFRGASLTYEEPMPLPAHETGIKLLAFYLPQFHPIPENDLWWGEGFTEWRNVASAKPLYPGHYQPKLPGPLGFYDLRLSEVMQRQIELAREFGIHGFCFHHYWFGGRRLLERPVEQLLANAKLDIPFCLCWANENWTRRWDGMEAEVLIEQRHSPEDDLAFIADALRYFRDPRYIRVEGKPVLVVYRPQILPDPKATVQAWRTYCEGEGLELYLVAAQTFGLFDPRPLGFDAAVQFPPHNLVSETIRKPGLDPDFRGKIYDYETWGRLFQQQSADTGYPLFRCVCPSWDNTARRGLKATMIADATPDKYADWLEAVCLDACQTHSPERRFVFLNAWNEWAEGTYIEPDLRHGYAWLNRTSAVLNRLSAGARGIMPPRICVIGHDAERAGAQNVLLALLREWKRTRPFSFCLILNGSGPLRSQFEECCPTIVLADYPDPGKRKTVLDTFLATRPPLVFSNTVVNGPLLKELQRLGAPVITHVHELQNSIERWAPGPIISATLECTNHFIAVSPPVAANLREKHRVAPEAISVIHAFIDTDRQSLGADALARLRADLGVTEQDVLVLGCGTIDWRKGVDLFVQIAAACVSEPRLRFAWIGGSTSEELATLDAEIERHGLLGRVLSLGQQTDPRRYFAIGQIFLLSSREDPFPLVALEAADAGLPVVCFAEAGGMPDFVGTECGIVVPFQDTAAAAGAIQRLASDETLRTRLGSQAREKVRREHSTPVAAARIAELVNGLAHAGAPIESSPDARPLVTVLVPNYNHAPFLARRLESIIAQGIEDMEILIFDDASTDESRAVIEAFAAAHPRTRLVFNEVNSGSTFKQWRKGLGMARGHFVWIAESDDSAEPGLLRALLDKLQRHTDAAFAYAQSRMLDDTDRDLGLPLGWTADLSATRWLEDFAAPGHEEIRTVLSIKNSIPNASAVVFRNFDGIVDLVDDSMRLCADWLFWVRLCRRGGVVFDARPLNHWRQRTSNARTRPPGELEWEEGTRVLDECAESLGLTASERQELYSTFRARCEAWKEAANGTARILETAS